MSYAKSTKILTGNTFPFRDEIRAIGGRWDKDRKAWVVEPGTMRQRAEQSNTIHRLEQKGVKVELA